MVLVWVWGLWIIVAPVVQCDVLYLSALVSEELPSVVDDLFICEVGVRLLLTNAQHLPQSDPKRPHVAGCGELTLRQYQYNIYVSLNGS